MSNRMNTHVNGYIIRPHLWVWFSKFNYFLLVTFAVEPVMEIICNPSASFGVILLIDGRTDRQTALHNPDHGRG